MIVKEESAASRQFVASTPFLASKWTGKRGYIYLFWGLAAYSTLNFVVAPKLVFGAALGFVLVRLVAYLYWYSRRKIRMCVTSDALTVNRRQGDVFSLVDAQLGVLGSGMTMGTSLHLRCGPHIFVLGGRNHGIANGRPLEAPAVDKVDAWLWTIGRSRLQPKMHPAANCLSLIERISRAVADLESITALGH
jgi:hypothetical protein